MGQSGTATKPHILTVPGLMNSGPGHWQSRWEASSSACHRVDLGNWDRPHRNSWVNRLNQAINAWDGPILLAAHSLGCHAVAWWAALACTNWSEKIQGALLVAPPEVDARAADSRLHGFAPLPQRLLPFPSILVASHNDPYMPFERSRELERISTGMNRQGFPTIAFCDS
jgi:predicted alpha/beta hydrolase family esterase